MPEFKYLGESWRSKPDFNSKGEALYASGFDNVVQAIARALSIDGDVFFLRRKKSRLNQLQFQPRDAVTGNLLRFFILKAIQDEVNQVSRASVTLEYPTNEPSLIRVRIDFSVKGANASGTMIYPFYLQNNNNGQ